MIKYFAYFLTVVSLQAATGVRISDYAKTNEAPLGAVINLALPGNTNLGIYVSNLLTQAGTVAPLLKTADSFVFIGDSRVADPGPAGVGNQWPTRLMGASNYFYHLYYYNFGLGGSGMPIWTNTTATSRYVTNVTPLTPITNGYLFCELGVNDIGSGPSITNALKFLWTNAQAQGFKVIATTIATNFSWTSANSATGVAVNIQIRAMTPFYNYLLDLDKLITNSNQMLDGLHYTLATAFDIANYVNTNIVPANSSFLSQHLGLPNNLTVKTIYVTNMLYSRGLRIIGPTAGTVAGYGIRLDYDSPSGYGYFFNGYDDYSTDIRSFLPLFVDSSPIHFSQYSGAHLEFHTGADLVLSPSVVITNLQGPCIYFLTNSTAVNGSVYLDTNGIFWTRSNSLWRVR